MFIKIRKYEHITTIVFELIKNKSLTNHIMLYIIGEEPCKYLKHIVHYYILNELQLFNLSRHDVYHRHYVDNIISVSLLKLFTLRQVKRF